MTSAAKPSEYREVWDQFGQMDPYWAVLSHPSKKYGKWDSEEFFLTGLREIEQLLVTAKMLNCPSGRDTALDFGCGVGRLTRALSRHFQKCYGVDISVTMLAKARELNRTFGNCNFVHNDKENLQIFADNHFDLVYSNIVLQHIPSSRIIKSYISEFVRVVKPGGLVAFQLPSRIPLLRKILCRRRLYALFNRVGVAPAILYHNLGLHGIWMRGIAEKEVLDFLRDCGAKTLQVIEDVESGSRIVSKTYYLTK